MVELPCREGNPFATCWTRPDALTYQPTPGATVEAIVDSLGAGGWRGQIVGPHGAGKSTLLKALVEPLKQSGFRPVWWERGEPNPRSGSDFLLVEGFERLDLASAIRELIRWRTQRRPFLLTTHRRLPQWLGGPPTVACLRPDPDLTRRLFQRVTAGSSTPVTWGDARASFRRQRGNLREVWFDLYDLHESRTKAGRTVPVVASYGLPGIN